MISEMKRSGQGQNITLTGAAAIIGRLYQMTLTPKSKGLKQK